MIRGLGLKFLKAFKIQNRYVKMKLKFEKFTTEQKACRRSKVPVGTVGTKQVVGTVRY